MRLIWSMKDRLLQTEVCGSREERRKRKTTLAIRCVLRASRIERRRGCPQKRARDAGNQTRWSRTNTETFQLECARLACRVHASVFFSITAMSSSLFVSQWHFLPLKLQLVVERLIIVLARMISPFLSTTVSLISCRATSVVFMPS
jgi:hypothetical protein